jgi:PAS domain S-box-containing protein
MSQPTYTLLIVADFLEDREHYCRLLLKDPSCNYEIIAAALVAEGLQLCQSRSIDAILLDDLLSDDGLTFLELLSEQSNEHRPPVVIITGQGNESGAVRAMKMGAQDYLVKRDLTPELLQSSIKQAIFQWKGYFDSARYQYANENHRLRQQLQHSEDRFQASIAATDAAVEREFRATSIDRQIAADRDRNRFFDLSIDLLAVGNFAGYFERVNPAWEKVFGYTATALMAEPYLNFIHPDDRAKTIVAAQNISTDKSVNSLENRYRCQDGSYRWLLWNAMPCMDVGLFYAIGRDITELKQTEALLRQSERKFSAIFDQTFELLGIVSLEGVLLAINQAALDSIAARSEDLIGKPFWDTPWWHTPQLQQQLRDSIDLALSGKFIRYEVEFPNPNGGMSIIDFSLKPIFDDDLQVVTIVAEARDITEQQAAFRERQLAQLALEQRNQDLDSFTYIVSHDLKAPLRAITNLSQWIEDDLEAVLTADTQQHLNLLRSRVHRMELTISGLLEYARVGRTANKIEPVIVAQLIAETIDSLAPPATFTIAVAPMPTFDTKRLLLSQVFANLIGNSIKHHHDPGAIPPDRSPGSIQISVRELDNFYEFAVSDDGVGIAIEDRDRIFTIFQSGTPQQHSDSSGIGLAIVKKIVEAETGKIWLESELDRGTTFYFTWPKKS